MINLREAVASRRDWKLALFAVAVLLVMTACVLPFERTFVGRSLPILAIIISLATAGFAMTGILLWTQSAVTKSVPVSILALGYGVTAAIMVPYLLLFRGLWPEFALAISADPQSPNWLWLEWHLAFVFSAILYQVTRASGAAIEVDADFLRWRRVMFCATIAIFALVVSPVIWIDNLPALSLRGQWTPLSIGGTVLISLAALAAFILSFIRSPRRRTLDLWLGIACLAMILDAIISKTSGQAFSLGWYFSRLEILVCSIALLVALLFEVAGVYANLAITAERLRNESLTDALTEIGNRRGFDQHFDGTLRAAKREKESVSLLLIDIDHFKAFNDAFGHPAGDRCLQQIARVLLQNAFRPGDMVARIGGEEFAIVMGDTELTGARNVAERIRAAVEDLALPQGRAAHREIVTVSIGIANAAGPSELVAESLMFEADQALYRAKSLGRNGVCTSSDGESPAGANVPPALQL